jgi:hydrogenase maturation protein HypF
MKKPGLDGVGMDLHPGYETGMIAKRFADEFDVPLFKIQHHWAHALSLLKDNDLEEGIVLCLDGLGYGDDGTLWGGEILHCDVAFYHRVGHLKPIPLLGGDKATQDPRRLVFAILAQFEKERFFTGTDASILRQLLSKAPLTSSFARVLDALSCMLEICQIRSYEGEPAMKLEPFLAEGSVVHQFDVKSHQGIIDTPDLFNQLDEMMKKQLKRKEKANLVSSFVCSLLETMAHIAMDYAQHHSIDHIGITGGVSYNIPLLEMLHKIIEKNDFSLFVHKSIPNGDGGIAIGQNLIAANMISSDKCKPL